MDSNPQPDGRATPDPEHDGYPAPENAVRSPGEIGGKKFRVGLDDAYVPFRNRTKRRRKTMAVALGGLLILGVGAYGLVNLVTAPTQTAAAAACKAGSAHALAGPAEVARRGGRRRGRGGRERQRAEVHPQRLQLDPAPGPRGARRDPAQAARLRHRPSHQRPPQGEPDDRRPDPRLRLAVAELHEVAAEVPGAQIKTDARTDPSVDLVLGAGFTTLASTQQVTTELQAAAAAASATAAANNAAAACAH
jgi:hypothetical protein